MTCYCFEVELLTATAQDVHDSLPGMPYQVSGFTSVLGTSVILTVVSDDDEDLVFDAIASKLPPGTKLYKTTRGYTPVEPSPIGKFAQKFRDKHYPPGAVDEPKNKP